MTICLNIFDFSDYRTYILAWLESAKKKNAFNRARLAAIAKVHPTFLSQVLTGGKGLSLEHALLLSEYFQHKQVEQDYFFAMINLDRAGTEGLRNYWKKKKRQIEFEKNKLSERFKNYHEISEEQRATFYSAWYYVAAWVTTSINNGQTLEQVAERFHFTRNKAEEIMNFLVQCGVCEYKKGKYSLGKAHIHISNESSFVVKHHTNWRHKAMQRMDFREASELFFTAPMTVSAKNIEVLREKLNLLVKDIVSTVTDPDTNSEEIVCLNIDFFKPMT